jgi:hypothetical protein
MMVVAGAGAMSLHAEPAYRVSAPVVHDNLAVYFIHGARSAAGVPLTLQEAMTRDAVRVYETGNVNELAIENVGGEEVFVQAGDIVKGGKQDRALTVSLVLPPHSGRVSIASFCVEQGRWSARGREDVAKFSSSNASAPRQTRVAMVTPPAPHVAGNARSETASRQHEVWKGVAAAQAKLSDKVGAVVASPASRSSLQLALENEKLKERQKAYLAALEPASGKASDIIGVAFGINGKVSSAELYPSNGLFRKMWAKLLRASVTEAIAEKADAADARPAPDKVLAFLAAAEGGKPTSKPLTAAVRLETRDADHVLFFASARANGEWIHRSYLAK